MKRVEPNGDGLYHEEDFLGFRGGTTQEQGACLLETQPQSAWQCLDDADELESPFHLGN